MIWLLLAMSAASLGEGLSRLPLGEDMRALAWYGGKSYRVMANGRISDHWKERVLPLYAGKIFRASLRLLGALLLCLALLGGWHLLAGFWGFDLSVLYFTPAGMAAMSVSAGLYLFLRRRVRHG